MIIEGMEIPYPGRQDMSENYGWESVDMAGDPVSYSVNNDALFFTSQGYIPRLSPSEVNAIRKTG